MGETFLLRWFHDLWGILSRRRLGSYGLFWVSSYGLVGVGGCIYRVDGRVGADGAGFNEHLVACALNGALSLDILDSQGSG